MQPPAPVFSTTLIRPAATFSRSHGRRIQSRPAVISFRRGKRGGISRKLSVPNAERIFFIRHALRTGFTLSKNHRLTKIDRWFLARIKEIVDFEEELAGAQN